MIYMKFDGSTGSWEKEQGSLPGDVVERRGCFEAGSVNLREGGNELFPWVDSIQMESQIWPLRVGGLQERA